MTSVFVLFLVKASLGLLVCLPLVSERAGERFFKLCSASAALMLAMAAYMLYRRLALATAPPGLASPGAMLPLLVVCLLFTTLYNRARHFGWQAGLRPLLLGALASGALALVLSSPASDRALVVTDDLTSVLLLGAATTAMILGHFYLVVLDLPIGALRRLTVLLIISIALRGAFLLVAFAGPVRAGFDAAWHVASAAFDPDGIFVWMRVLFGVVGPASLSWFIWKTVEIRSTQSATGILYVQLFLVLSGELLATYLQVTAGMAL